MSRSKAQRIQRVGELLRDLGHHSVHLSRRLGQHSGVNATDLDAITILLEHDRPMTVSELGRALDLSSAAVTSAVDRLEAAGHVHRRRDTADRRKVHVEATGLAASTAFEVMGGFLELLQQELERCTADELEAAEKVLGATVRAFEAAEAAG